MQWWHVVLILIIIGIGLWWFSRGDGDESDSSDSFLAKIKGTRDPCLGAD